MKKRTRRALDAALRDRNDAAEDRAIERARWREIHREALAEIRALRDALAELVDAVEDDDAPDAVLQDAVDDARALLPAPALGLLEDAVAEQRREDVAGDELAAARRRLRQDLDLVAEDESDEARIERLAGASPCDAPTEIPGFTLSREQADALDALGPDERELAELEAEAAMRERRALEVAQEALLWATRALHGTRAENAWQSVGGRAVDVVTAALNDDPRPGDTPDRLHWLHVEGGDELVWRLVSELRSMHRDVEGMLDHLARAVAEAEAEGPKAELDRLRDALAESRLETDAAEEKLSDLRMENDYAVSALAEARRERDEADARVAELRLDLDRREAVEP